MTLFSIVFERKVVARMQQRSGPNRVGPGGWGQSLADGLKLAFKEDIIPALADRPVYLLAPVLSAVPAFLAFSVIPFGPKVSVAGNETALQLTDLPVGVLWVLACASLGVFGIVLAGWSSGSTYPLLGGLRSAAQVISYEIAMALALIAVFLYAGSLSTSEIVAAQNDRWFIITLPVSFVIYVIAITGETNRAPFDLPEAESELVGGFHTEYTSLKFAMFFLAEYINIVTVSALATTLFLGGWQPIWPFSQVAWMSRGLSSRSSGSCSRRSCSSSSSCGCAACCPACATTPSCASAGRCSSRSGWSGSCSSPRIRTAAARDRRPPHAAARRRRRVFAVVLACLLSSSRRPADERGPPGHRHHPADRGRLPGAADGPRRPADAPLAARSAVTAGGRPSTDLHSDREA